VIVNDQKLFPRPLAQAFLHKVLREEVRVRQLHGVEFFSRANVEQLNLFTGGKAVGEFARLDLHRTIRFVTDHNMLDNFIDIQIFISRANASQSFVGTEPATAAAADMITAKHRALRSGKVFQEFPHRDARINGDRGIHVAMNLKARTRSARHPLVR
jgi:hypothetical protein